MARKARRKSKESSESPDSRPSILKRENVFPARFRLLIA
jgi:hypothetical protein